MAKFRHALVLLASASCGDNPVAETVTAAQCGGDLKFFHPDHAEWVGMDRRTSNELLVARKMKLAADRYSRSSLFGWEPLGVTGISWCSAAPNVVRIEGDSAVALATGSATLFAFDDQGRGDSLTVHVVATGYALTFLGEGITNMAMNDSGDVVVGTATSGTMLRNATTTDLGNCVPRSLNNRRQVACFSRSGAEPKAFIWDAGNISGVRLGSLNVTLSSINDSGDVAGYTSEGGGIAFIIHGSDTLRIRNDTLRLAKVSSVSKLTNRRELLSHIFNSFNEPVPGVLSSKGVSPLCCRHGGAGSLSDSGTVAGDRRVYGRSVPVTWSMPNRYAPAYLGPAHAAVVNPIEGGATGVNNREEVVGVGYGVGFLWRDQRTINLNSVLMSPDWIVTSAAAINGRAQILALATNTKTGAKGAALLTPAQLP